MGRTLDGDYINPSLIQQWKTYYLQSHGDRCSERLARSASYSLMWLIDTKRNCLISGSDCRDTSYVALSYVWGQVSMMMNAKERLEMLQQDGALGSFVP